MSRQRLGDWRFLTFFFSFNLFRVRIFRLDRSIAVLIKITMIFRSEASMLTIKTLNTLCTITRSFLLFLFLNDFNSLNDISLYDKN